MVMPNREKLINPGRKGDIAAQLSEEVDFKIFPGEEDILKDPKIAGVIAGTHEVVREITADGKTVLVIYQKGLPQNGHDPI